MLLTGDLGFAAIEPFAETFPDRFYNVGVAEQNMLGIATGLAEAGFLPFVYSIAPFATRRPYEFIHNGPVLHKLPVRIVGIGGGFEYGHAGPTHHGIDDVALMRVLPEIAIISPADHEQAVTALWQTWDWPGPVYYRLGKDDATTVPGLGGEFQVGRTQCLRQGTDLALIAMGSVATEAEAAARDLARCGVQASVVVVASVRPTPTDDLAAALSRVPLAMSVEAHSINGGLGSLVAEIIAEQGMNCRLMRCGVRVASDGTTGANRYQNAAHGLSREALVDQALCALRAT
jgi:transketolase